MMGDDAKDETTVPVQESDQVTEVSTVERGMGVRSCNLPGCTELPTTRGLCEVHWCTHRGLADPEPVVPTTPVEAMP